MAALFQLNELQKINAFSKIRFQFRQNELLQENKSKIIK
jgi:hypothetical protein